MCPSQCKQHLPPICSERVTHCTALSKVAHAVCMNFDSLNFRRRVVLFLSQSVSIFASAYRQISSTIHLLAIGSSDWQKMHCAPPNHIDDHEGFVVPTSRYCEAPGLKFCHRQEICRDSAYVCLRTSSKGHDLRRSENCVIQHSGRIREKQVDR